MDHKQKIFVIMFLTVIGFYVAPKNAAAQLYCPEKQDQFIGATTPISFSGIQVGDDFLNQDSGDNNDIYKDFSFDYDINIPYPPCAPDNAPVDTVRRKCNPQQQNSIKFGVGINSSHSFFTSIYTNFLGMLPAVTQTTQEEAANILASNPEAKKSWDRYYCISGLDDFIDEGTFTSGSTGSITYQVERKTEEKNRITIPIGCSSDDPLLSGDPLCICVDPAVTDDICYDKNERWVTETRVHIYTAPPNIQKVAIPYADGLREVAKKTSAMINYQYCNTSEIKPCLDGLSCIDFETIIANKFRTADSLKDPAANGKNGLCVPFTQTTAGLQPTNATRPQMLCSDLTSGKGAIGRLNSNVCFYDANNLRLVSCKDGLAAGCGSTYPYLNSGGIDAPTNSLPFDTDLFADYGEKTNPACNKYAKPEDVKNCVLDGFYKRVFDNKLSLYTDEEKKWYDNLPGYIDVAGKITGSVTDPVSKTSSTVVKLEPDNAPGYYKDLIDKLGKYYEMSNDARFMNPNLLPSGFKTISHGGISAYLRSVNNSFAGILFVDGHPVGALPTAAGETIKSPQYDPYIYTNGRTRKTVISTVLANQEAYIMTVDLNGGRTPLTKVASLPRVHNIFSQFSFINSQGDVLFAARTPVVVSPPGFIYTIYNGRGFTSPHYFNSTSMAEGSVYMDDNDQVHVLGTSETGSGIRKLYYAKYLFRDGMLKILINPMEIDLPNELNSYTQITPMMAFNIGPDGQGGALIVANTAIEGSVRPPGANDEWKDWWDNDIYLTRVDASGNIVQKEYAVKQSESLKTIPASLKAAYPNTRPTVHHKLVGNGIHVMRTYLPAISGYETTLVYTKTINMQNIKDGPKNTRNGKAVQVSLAKKSGDTGSWVQDIQLSELMDEAYGEINWPSLDPAGKVSVSLVDYLTRYDSTTKSFDAAGYKQCVYDSVYQASRSNSRSCGLITPTTAIVIPPTQKIPPEAVTCESFGKTNVPASAGKLSCIPFPRYY